MKLQYRQIIKPTIVIALSLLLFGCGKTTTKATDTKEHVDVEIVKSYDVPYVINYPAMVQGVVDYQVIPRISGVIYKKFYKEGSFIKKEQPLYEVDPRPYELQLKNYKGQLIKDKAAQDNLKIIYKRYVDLYKYKAVSRQDIETARINYEAAVGNVQTDQANIEQAKLNLLYCLVRSPADGYIGERAVTEGTMVTAYQTVLNNINSANHMYLLFSMPENQRVEIENGILDKSISIPPNYTFRVDIQLADGKLIKDAGYVEFTDTRISLENGVWNMRAYVDNAFLKNKLLAGQYVTVYIRGIKFTNTFVLPQQAILHSDNGAFVYIVKDNKSVKQNVITGKMFNDKWMITSGLQDGDAVIISGNIHLSNNMDVIIDNKTQTNIDVLNNNPSSNIQKEITEMVKNNEAPPKIAKKIERLNKDSLINTKGY